MKRVAIIGRPGSGKSYLARQVAEVTSLPLVHLDKVYHSLHASTPVEEFKSTWRSALQEIADDELWITDGNYGGNFDIRLPRADTIILLDYKLHVSLRRLLKRRLQYRKLNSRIDMPEGWRERFNLDFYRYHVFGIKKKEWYLNTLRLIDELKDTTDVIILKTPRQTRRYVKHLSRNAATHKKTDA